jgi:hypothetical protein
VTVDVGPNSIVKMKDGSIQVFPNPARNIVFIKSSLQSIEAEILNMLGERMIKQHISGNGTINTSDLAAGDYILTVTNTITLETIKTKLTVLK